MDSWEQTLIPETFLTFFSSLFGIRKSRLLKIEMLQMPKESADDNDDYNGDAHDGDNDDDGDDDDGDDDDEKEEEEEGEEEEAEEEEAEEEEAEEEEVEEVREEEVMEIEDDGVDDGDETVGEGLSYTENDSKSYCRWSLKNQQCKLFCLFQTMFYHKHHGAKKTPLHVMLGQHIYAKDKSREMLTTTNRIGVSISYMDVRRSRRLLAEYAIL